MKKVLLIMAAALMTMTQCRKQETMPVTPSANTIKMTITAGSGAKTDINTETGAITWSAGDKLYVSDGSEWLGSLDLVGEGGSAQGTFTGSIAGIDESETTCHFFYLGHDNGMEEPAAGTSDNVGISFAAQGGTLDGAMKYHLGHGTTAVTVTEGGYEGYVLMNTKIAMAHISFTTDGTQPYTGSLTMGGAGVSNEMTVSPGGAFTGSGTDGITIDNGDGITGERYVTLIPTGTADVLNVAFTGDAAGSMTFLAGIHENKFYGMKDALTVTVTSTTVPVESVSLNKTTLSLEVGATETLTATVTPDDAIDHVTWSSSATGVATVENGVVTAVSAGTATITVTATNGTEATDDDKTATCTVTVTAAHEYVDLGLPSGLLWAKCNLGADSPEDYGDYYAWGEILPYYADGHSQDNPCSTWRNMTTGAGNTDISNGYAWKTYSQGGSGSFVEWTAKPYGSDNVLTTGLDAASANWGGSWRMPTEAEFTELINNTTRTWTTVNGVAGYKCVSKKEGYTDKYIFLPAAGYRDRTSLYHAGSKGYYWSSSLFTSDPNYGRRLSFYSSHFSVSLYDRYRGYPVRPVCPPQN